MSDSLAIGGSEAVDAVGPVATCPECERTLRRPAHAVGKVQCRHCRHVFVLGAGGRQRPPALARGKRFSGMFAFLRTALAKPATVTRPPAKAAATMPPVGEDKDPGWRTVWSWRIAWTYRPAIVRRVVALALVVAAAIGVAIVSQRSGAPAKLGAASPPELAVATPPPLRQSRDGLQLVLKLAPPPAAPATAAAGRADWPAYVKPLPAGDIELQFENRLSVPITVGFRRGQAGADILVTPEAIRSLWLEPGPGELIWRANDGSTGLTREAITVDHAGRQIIGANPASR